MFTQWMSYNALIPIASFDLFRPFCQYNSDSGTGYGMYGSSHMMSPFSGGLLLVLLLALVFIVLTRISRRSPTSGSTHEDSALEILKKRYARGEVSKEEYERIKRDLNE